MHLSLQIERVDAIPILVTWLQHMAGAEHIDSHWTPHREWDGVRYGQLAVLFLTFVLHERDHRLSALAEWVAAHHATLTALTGWTIPPADVTDDRRGHRLEILGKDASQITAVQQAVGRHIVRVYALPTDVARVDTTSFNVTHAPTDRAHRRSAHRARQAHLGEDHADGASDGRIGAGRFHPAEPDRHACGVPHAAERRAAPGAGAANDLQCVHRQETVEAGRGVAQAAEGCADH